MPRFAAALVIGVLVLASTRAAVRAAAPVQQGEAKAQNSSNRLQHLIMNPDDIAALSAFIADFSTEFLAQLFFYEDSNGAERQLDEFKAAVAQVTPTTSESKQKLVSAQNTISSHARMIVVWRATLADLETKLAAAPNDLEAARCWGQKVVGQVNGDAYRDLEQAERVLEAAKSFASKILDSTKNREVQRSLRLFLLSRLELNIESGRKMLDLVGKDAPPLRLRQWVNSAPIEPADLKGKVILLDFFHLSRHRMATVPQVREWQARFAENGLVVVGVTPGLHGLQWDVAQKSLVPYTGDLKINLTRQQESLRQALDFHAIKYPFAIQERRPHPNYEFGLGNGLVVIDRQGKVRMVCVPRHERDALEVGKLVAELVGPK